MKVEFTKNFANKKKGDVADYDGMLARHLIDVDKVAKEVKANTKKTASKKTK